MIMEKELKPFDKILVRNCIMGQKGYWIPALYGFKSKDMKHYLTSAGWQEECIPYEGNEEYLGTTKDYVDIVSKFKVGNWLVENEPNNYARFVQILEIVDIQGKKRYRISRDIHNDEDIAECRFVEKYYHKFDIQDTKDGDVLVDKYGNIGIYQGDKNIVTWHSYCYCGEHGGFFDEGSHEYPCHPATKEQRNLLFQKMHEAGYEWDADKLELKKVEKKLAEWSEEDERMFKSILSELRSHIGVTSEEYSKYFYWLKSLKNRVQPQPKQEWSEEDNEHIKSIISTIECSKAQFPNSPAVLEAYNSDLIWLKSLRPQSHWMPSEEQIGALNDVISSRDIKYDVLSELWKDLKKLREE